MNNSGLTRLQGIDIIRGLAVVLMVQQHLITWLWKMPWNSINDLLSVKLHMLSLNVMGGIAAPLFVTIAGFGYIYFVSSEKYSDKQIIVRGLVILCAGYLMNILIPSWFSGGSWYVLHLIGAAFLISPVLRRIPLWGLFFLVIVFVFTAPFIQTFLNTPLFLDNKRMGNLELGGFIFRLAFVEGHFPLFPWLAFYLSGMISASWFKEKKYLNILYLAVFYCIVSGSLYLIYSSQIFTIGKFFRFFKVLPSFYPALPPMIFILMGLSLIIIFIFLYFFDIRRNSRFMKPFVLLGRISLTVLILHAVVFRELFIRIGLLKSFNEWITLLTIYGSIGLFILGAYFWQRISYKGSIEWFMRWLSNKV